MSQGKLLVDTNIISYIMKGDDRAKRYVQHLENKLLAISFITVGELYFWAEKNGWGERKRNTLEAALHNYVVIPYDNEIAKFYAKVATERERAGRRISCNDAWIAASALRHEIPLVTHNAKDFQQITSLDIITE
jgi:tRNA(fMet)-specific endonuclease VapC